MVRYIVKSAVLLLLFAAQGFSGDTDFKVGIEIESHVYLGSPNFIKIYLDTDKDFTGFDFLIAYDTTKIGNILDVKFDTSLSLSEDNRYNLDFEEIKIPGVDTVYPVGFIHITSRTDLSKIRPHPRTFEISSQKILLNLKCLMTNDRRFECAKIPLRFYWRDINDNVIYNENTGGVYRANKVIDIELNNNNDFFNSFPTFRIPDHKHSQGRPFNIKSDVAFYNGGLKNHCSYDIDTEGDLDLNGLPYTQADLEMFANYFLIGDEALVYVDHMVGYRASRESGDINKDKRPLTIEDFALLACTLLEERYYISNPPQPFPWSREELETHLIRDTTIARFFIADQKLNLRLSRGEKIDVLYIEFDGIVEPVLKLNKFDIKYGYYDNITRAIIYPTAKGVTINPGIILSNITAPIRKVEAAAFSVRPVKCVWK